MGLLSLWTIRVLSIRQIAHLKCFVGGVLFAHSYYHWRYNDEILVLNLLNFHYSWASSAPNSGQLLPPEVGESKTTLTAPTAKLFDFSSPKQRTLENRTDRQTNYLKDVHVFLCFFVVLFCFCVCLIRPAHELTQTHKPDQTKININGFDMAKTFLRFIN